MYLPKRSGPVALMVALWGDSHQPGCLCFTILDICVANIYVNELVRCWQSVVVSDWLSRELLMTYSRVHEMCWITLLFSLWLKLKELKNLQQQYLQINQEITELRPLKARLQEYQDKTKNFQIMQEELRQENLSWQHELHQLRYDSPCFLTLFFSIF